MLEVIMYPGDLYLQAVVARCGNQHDAKNWIKNYCYRYGGSPLLFEVRKVKHVR